MPVVGVRVAEGRSGTTLLMQLLGTGHGVVFDDRYPAEYRWLSYFARMADRMLEPFDAARHPDATGFFFDAERAWGPVPFDSDLVDRSRLASGVLEGMWAAWSAEVRHRRPEAALYAEKVAVDIETIALTAIPLRVIDLVRDPRDVLASIRSFTARGVAGFGRRHDQDELEYVEQFVSTISAGVERMTATPATVDRLIVRYEDLILDSFNTVDRLSEWLGLELDHDAVTQQRSTYQQHMTSPSPEASVGRWQHDLDRPAVEILADRLGSVMEPLGYDLTPP
jgi:Sulfotransferase family